MNIINGHEDVDNDYPAVLYIEIYEGGDDGIWNCSSSVISHNTLLTAAHCLDKKNIKVVKATLPSGEIVEAKAFFC